MKPQRFLVLWAAGLLSCAAARAALVNVSNDVAGAVNWFATNIYVLKTVVYVQSNAVLTIEPGTVIKGETNVALITSRTGITLRVAALCVTRGGKLYATGTVDKPIIFTSIDDDEHDPDDMRHDAIGRWGGVLLLGNGRLNSIPPDSPRFGTPAPFVDQLEGTTHPGLNNEHLFGGTNDADSSGILRYVSIRYPGAIYTPSDEFNGLSLGAVGSGTTIEFVEVLNGADDGFEFWGGMVNTSHLLAAFCDDDDFDTDTGYRGTNQFWFGIKPPWLGSPDSRGLETDGDHDQLVLNETPISRWFLYNATLIGRGTNVILAARKTAWTSRDEAGPNVMNSIFTEWNSGLRMESDGLYHFTNATIVALANARNNIWNVHTNLDSATAPRGDFLFTNAGRLNTITNPLLRGISYTNDWGLDPRPQAGSPVFNNVLSGAPTTVGYRGAFGPNEGWADGWTALSQMHYLRPGQPQLTVATANSVNVTWLTLRTFAHPFSYQLQSTTNLQAGIWTDVGLPISGTGGVVTNNQATSGTSKFFRVTLK